MTTTRVVTTQPASGAWRIFRYNWPIYAATWTGAALALGAAAFVAGALAAALAAGALVAVAWSALSLVVSHVVYDRSPLAAGAWVPALLPAGTARWAAVDAGLDAEVALDDVMPGACAARLDLYDGVTVRAPSVQRARAVTPRAHAARPAAAGALPLDDASVDVVTVVFTAHEVRDRGERERFFHELARALAPGGRVLLVEHLRDAANFLAFGPGFLHFLPRREWLRLAALAGLRVAGEIRVTPFVMALALERVA